MLSKKTLGLGLGAIALGGAGAYFLKRKKGKGTAKKSSVAKMQQRLKRKQLKLQILKTDKKIFKEYLKV